MLYLFHDLIIVVMWHCVYLVLYVLTIVNYYINYYSRKIKSLTLKKN